MKHTINSTESASFTPQVTGYKKEHKRKRWLYNIVTVLSSVVVFVTTYALILPAITMDADEGAVCGYIAHTHSAECYDENDNLICDIPEHEHDMACFTEAKETDTYNCGYDYEHVHDDLCYSEGTLICTLQEHTHDITCLNLKYLNHVVNAEADDGAVVQVSGNLPDNVYVTVSMPRHSPDEIKEILGDSVYDRVGTNYVAYDISLFVGEYEYQPEELVDVRVINPAPNLILEEDSSIGVLHIADETESDGDITVQELCCYNEENLVSFTTDGFSEFIFYQVAVAGNGTYWTFDGGLPNEPEERTLAEIFENLGYTAHTAGQISNVTVTDPGEGELCAEYVNGVWKIVAYNAFYTREKITVTFTDNTRFEIIATGVAKKEKRPDYGTYTDTSLSKAVTDQTIDSAIRPSAPGRNTVDAYSDTATSKIENTQFNSIAEGCGSDAKYDGKVAVDKSVVYGDNDYYNGYTYSQDEFSVTLSTLAQQYEQTETYSDTVPVDVVFILDVSGSMNSGVDSTSRREQATQALNTLFNDIMALDNGSRVSVVTFGSSPNQTSDSWVQNGNNCCIPVKTLLPLGRYYERSGNNVPNYNTKNGGGYTFFTQSGSGSSGTISIASDIYSYDYTECNYATVVDGRYVPFEGWKTGATRTAVSGSTTVSMGTYTQGGIQQGANEFLAIEDPTWVSPATGKAYTRVPIFILISDGAPTYVNADYANPLGNIRNIRGNGGESNNIQLGAAGYYTVLTANYFKDRVAKHYGVPAAFYSIGMGINKTGETAAINSSSDSSGDHYKRAVLKPSPENIAALTSTTSDSYKNYGGVMYSLLHNRTVYPNANGTFGTTSFLYTDSYTQYEMSGNNAVAMSSSNRYIDVGNNTSYSILKNEVSINGRDRTLNRRYVRVVDNPYTSYQYADEGFFDSNWDPGVMSELVLNAVKSNIKAYSYTQAVKTSTTSIVITDRIGEGMEINTDDGLVLYYTDMDYPLNTSVGKTVTLTYDPQEDVWAYFGDATIRPNYYIKKEYPQGLPLSGINTSEGFERIEAKIITDPQGHQTIVWTVPNMFVPEYTHATIGMWYYEALPVRLIYKVGLTEDSKDAVRTLHNNSLTFYTNMTSNGATAEIVPGSSLRVRNPYYYSADYADTTEAKTAKGSHTGSGTGTANITGTMTNAYTTARTGSVGNYTVSAVMGNNGKLVYTQSEKTPDPSKGTTSLSVSKVWKNAAGTVITGSNIPETNVTLRLLADGNPYSAAGTLTLNSGNSWKGTWTNIPVKYDDDTDITWTYEETAVSGSQDKLAQYAITYTEEGGWTQLTGNNQSLKAGKIYYFVDSTPRTFDGSLNRINTAPNTMANFADPGNGSGTFDGYLWVAVENSSGGMALVPYANYLSGSNRYITLNRSGSYNNYTYSFATSTSQNYTSCTLVKNGSANTYALRYSYGNNTQRYIRLRGNTYSTVQSDTQANATYFNVYEYDHANVVTNQVIPKYDVTVQKVVPNVSGYWSYDFTASYEINGVTVSLGDFSLTSAINTKVFEDIPEGAVVTVSETVTGDCLISVSGTELPDGIYTGSAITGDTTITFVNRPLSELPATGGNGTYPYAVAGVVMITVSLAAVCLIIKRNRRKNYEEI